MVDELVSGGRGKRDSFIKKKKRTRRRRAHGLKFVSALTGNYFKARDICHIFVIFVLGGGVGEGGEWGSVT